MERDRDSGGASANNSSDFVRKLYKMLEDERYNDIVRWGNDGDSFVVLENDTFTRIVLPQHFKHSNFASFVRQLNKYDFHKVRQSNEETGASSYGAGAWEFKHPDFQKDGKESLDNIRRKAPAPRRTNQSVDDPFPAQHQLELLNSQLAASQQQFEVLQHRYNDLAQGHVVLFEQAVQLRKFVANRDFALHQFMAVLQGLQSQNRRQSRSGPFSTNGTVNGIKEQVAQENGVDDHIETSLRQAADVLGQYSVDELQSSELEEMHREMVNFRNEYATPPPHDPTSSIPMAVQNAAEQRAHASMNMLGNADLVYPVGQTVGIDPINKDHRNNIPYGLPNEAQNGAAGITMPKPVTEVDSRLKHVPNWVPRRPTVLLVEDDKVCQRIGVKFLQVFQCNTLLARDGLEAVNKLNNVGPNEKVDIIFMDIIMPILDGVSATSIIREFNTTTPIIAMTSNIRTDDIAMYFRYGMNDVLPKPFTKEGMWDVLERYLGHLLVPRNHDYAIPAPVSTKEPHPNFMTPATANRAMPMGIPHIPTTHSLKADSPAARSPATSWPSPNANSITCPSPTTAGPGDGHGMHATRQGANSSYAIGGGMSGMRNMDMDSPIAQTMAAPRQGGAHRRVMSDMSNGPEEHLEAKRQRMYQPPNPNTFT